MIDIADCTLKMKLFSSLFSVLALLVFGHFSALSQDTACHGLVVRVLPAYDGSGNLTPYVLARIYARPRGDNDKVFMVFGNDLFPLEIDCGGTSAFNNPASGYTNESIEQPNNPAYFNDSYVTIGQFAKTLDTPGNSTIASTELFPLANGSVNVASTLFSVFADSDYGTPSAISYAGTQERGWGIDSVSTPAMGFNSLPDSEGLVALAQITLLRGSPLSGTLNYKVQPDSQPFLPTEIASVDFTISAVFEGLDSTFATTGGSISGCTDETACNYNADTCSDDGSCEYSSCLGCTDSAACNYDGDAVGDDGSCEYISCQGCTDEGACNFDPNALIADDSCLFPGCSDTYACNYDPDACNDDGSCEFVSCLTFGCTDAGACNYMVEATVDNEHVQPWMNAASATGQGAVFQCGCANLTEGSCDCDGNQLDALGVCGGTCGADQDSDGICDDVDECIGSAEQCCADHNLNDLCDGDETVGCTYPAAENYNPAATMDDGTCIETETCVGDFNGDGQIQLEDLLDFFLLYGTSCP